MNDCVDFLDEATWFSERDTKSGYWQVVISEVDRDETTFTGQSRTYKFQRMPFHLTNAPDTFQPTLETLLSRFDWQ